MALAVVNRALELKSKEIVMQVGVFVKVDSLHVVFSGKFCQRPRKVVPARPIGVAGAVPLRDSSTGIAYLTTPLPNTGNPTHEDGQAVVESSSYRPERAAWPHRRSIIFSIIRLPTIRSRRTSTLWQLHETTMSSFTTSLVASSH